MTEQDIGKILSGQLFSLMNDSRYGYRSSVANYSHLKEEGIEVMSELVKMLAPKVVDIIVKREEELAKQKMIDTIKS